MTTNPAHARGDRALHALPRNGAVGRPLRIAQVAAPFEAVPPAAYGGTERVVDALVTELIARGHEVTTYASGDSTVAGRLVPTVPQALRPAGFGGDATAQVVATALQVLDDADQYDLIHTHLGWPELLLDRATPTPTVHTLHGRLDLPAIGELLHRSRGWLVAISENQAATQPEVDWARVVHNGLDLSASPSRTEPGEDLCFVGRISPEKGVLDAIEVARQTGRRLRIAAKAGPTPEEQEYYRDVFQPALKRADVEFVGELRTEERGRLVAESYASLVPGVWPEPFGLVVIESLSTGTPVLGRRVGALPEIIREGVDGFFGDDVSQLAFLVDRIPTLDRAAIRASVLERFSAARMADGYEEVYRRAVAGNASGGTGERQRAAGARGAAEESAG